MANKKKSSKRPRAKRGPKEERLIIADPQKALNAILKPKKGGPALTGGDCEIPGSKRFATIT